MEKYTCTGQSFIIIHIWSHTPSTEVARHFVVHSMTLFGSTALKRFANGKHEWGISKDNLYLVIFSS